MKILFQVFMFFGAGVISLYAEPVEGLVMPFKQVSVSAPVQEIIQEVAVNEGDVVKEGQIIVQLLNEKEQLDVKQYEELLKRREFEAQGAETLLKEKIQSKLVAIEKRTDLELTKIQLQAARVREKEKAIRSPISGIVVKKYKETGEAVDRVEKLVDIVNIDKVYVQFYLDPKWLPKIREGMIVPVQFPLLENGGVFEGTVSFVDPRIDAGSGLFRIKLLLDNPDHVIRAGMQGRADFAQLRDAEGG